MDVDNMVVEFNSHSYLVVESIEYDNKTYVYLVNSEDELDSMFREIIIDDNSTKLKKIDPELFTSKLVALFMEKIQS